MFVVVMSPVGRAGKTTTALALCRAAALAGRKALAIELDFSPGSFRALFDVERGGGVVAAVRSPSVLSSLSSLASPSGLGFDVLPGGFPEEDEMVAGQPLLNFLAGACREYDLVVADTAGKLSSSSVDAARQADLVLVVVPGDRGEEGIRRTYIWADYALVREVIFPGRTALVLNRVPRKLMWLFRETLGSRLPLAAVLPELKAPAVADGRLARKLMPVLGLKELRAPGNSVFSVLRKRWFARGLA